nr:hypothetical protein [Tanacetum cinerariifolium]
MEYGISEALHPELPEPEDRIVDFSESKNNRFFWVDERVFPTIVDWRTSAPNDGMPAENTYSLEAVRVLDTHRTPIQKQPEALVCLVGLSRRYYLGDKVYPTFLHDDDRGGTVNWAGRPGNCGPRGATPREHEYHRRCSRGRPRGKGCYRRSPAAKERRKRGQDVVDTNAPLKVLRRDHADPRPTGGTRGGKSLAAIELGMGSTRPTPAPQGAPADVSDPDPLSFADPRSRPTVDIAQSSKGAAAAGDPESENTSFASMVGSPESIYRPEWGIMNGSMLDTPEACQDLVDHVAPPGYFSELRHLHNDDFLKRYNVNLARQVAMGSQLRLRENEIKNMETLLEAEADMKKAAKDKSAKLSQELEHMRALFSDLQVSNNRLSQQVSTLQEQVSGEEKLKAAFEEFKQYEDNRVEQYCAEIDARLDALSIDFDEELYPHMLTAIAGRRWMIGRGLRFAVMKCGKSIELRQAFADVVSAGIAKGMSEGLKHEVEHGHANLDLEAIEASSQLTIPVYPEVRDPLDPWACKEEILLSDAIAANVSRAEKKKKCRVADAATQTETSDEASPQLLSSVLYAPWESLRTPNVLGV